MNPSELVRRILKALPQDATEARLALSLLAREFLTDDMKGKEDGAPTVVRHHAKETQ